MTIEAGTKLAHYELVAPIGKGGMGEVYRAHDSKLGRDVAIKVLPDELARDRDRLDRFDREARLLAQVNHANIATLHGIDEHDGKKFLVMELVEGETLAERIARGPVPLDEAMPLLVQIAEGLEAAHEKGIVHRDLKPANIKIGTDGKPKILDFGLAKAFADDTEPLVDSSQSPTLTKGTALGVIMGTASYMSPEQARGKPLDRRTDIWAFGCCVYEALSGRKAFAGETVTDTLARIVAREPDWNVLPASTPRATRTLLERCLRKKKEDRLRSAGDIALGLREEVDAPMGRGSTQRERPWLIGAVAMLVGALGGYLLRGSAVETTSDGPTHWTVPLPPNGTIHGEGISLSPDGSMLVAAVELDGKLQLYRKSVDSAVLEPIPETEGGFAPFFSPDGEWIGFFADGRLQKIPVDGGRPIGLCESTRTIHQAAWGVDGTIVLRGDPGFGLVRCSADGGDPEALTKRGQLGETSHSSPTFLPDGSILFGTGGGTGDVSLALLPRDSDEWAAVPVASRAGRFVPPSYLVYEWEGRLLAAEFDPSEPTRVGRETILIDGLHDAHPVSAAFDVSSSGTLAYVPGGVVLDQLVWVDRNGRVTSEIGEPGKHMYPRASPAGDRISVSLRPRPDDARDIWLYDAIRGSRTRLSFVDSAWVSEWSPDGRRVAFMGGFDQGPRGMYVISVDGGGAPDLLREDVWDPSSWSPDGETLLFHGGPSLGRGDVWALDTDGESEPRPVLNEGYDERVAVFSPDGKWIAYTSNESGRTEVYAQPYPGPGRKYSVSTRGGVEPRWSRDGRELFFRNGDAMMVVDVRFEPELAVGEPRVLFRGDFYPAPATSPNYDVSPDGEHFLMIQPTGDPPREIRIILNWAQELERLVPNDLNR